VVGVLPRAGGADLVVEGTDGDPAVQDVFRVRTAYGGDQAKLTHEPGWHRAVVGGDVLVLDDTVWRGDAAVHVLASHAAPYPYAPRPILERVTDRRLPAAVLYPGGHVAGTPLAVLVDLGDGPVRQQVVLDRGDWQERQWFADAGFAVVAIDPRGTPGIGPSFEKVVHRRLVDVALADLADGLRALLGKHPDLDLRRVAVRGTGLGGWLAASAVQRRPDPFRLAAVRSPVLDWAELPRPFAERYLGRRADSPEPYDHHAVTDLPDTVLVLPSGRSLDAERDQIRRLLESPESS
jgi:dipeptidyl-peptidase 4